MLQEFISEEDAWHLMDKKANASAVREFMEETGNTPPGVSFRDEITVRVTVK